MGGEAGVTITDNVETEPVLISISTVVISSLRLFVGFLSSVTLNCIFYIGSQYGLFVFWLEFLINYGDYGGVFYPVEIPIE